MIFAHNHPSGLAEPSQADELLTRTLRQALALVDIRVLDHFIVGEGAAMSFAERGLIEKVVLPAYWKYWKNREIQARCNSFQQELEKTLALPL